MVQSLQSIEVGSRFVTDRAGKPQLFVAGQAPRGKHFEVRRLVVVHLDTQGRLLDYRQVTESNLQDELAAFGYERQHGFPGSMLVTGELRELESKVRDLVYDAFPSSAEFERTGREFRCVIHGPDGPYNLVIKVVKVSGDLIWRGDVTEESDERVTSFSKKGSDFEETLEQEIRASIEVP